ncbi:hypothetical protein LSH36_26g03010 [Paralvinella palmiformis]|uniref:Sulphur transport domain-containing protein n=1 Tax=Paralvinella palmiformis TaxID=53620 RepID=A0AAD9K9H1_9ANNE|nr:hypothetical protein LSH36_26g03010 [Paralvinella palmiformis]
MSGSWTPKHNEILTKVDNADDRSRNGDEVSKSDIESQEGDQRCLLCCAPESRPGMVVAKLAACSLAGVVFGWSMEKSRVFEPSSIRLQMVFQRWIMLKMFLAAMASGQVVIALLSVLPWCKTKFEKAMDNFACCLGDKGILTSLLGPFILGMGMTLSGSCPGMILPQIGSWTKNSMYTFLGVLVGALLYGFVAQYVVKLTRPKRVPEKLTLHDLVKLPYIALAMPMGIIILIIVFLMEWFIPWDQDLDCWDRNYIATPDSTNIFTLKSWYPSASGVLLGVLQAVIIFAADDTLGGSSAYVTMVSQWVIGKRLKELFPYLAKARCGLANWWQVFYVLFAVLGGAFSALSSDSLANAQGVTAVCAFFGGLFLVLGARLAAGCTSGHGLSGMGLLYWYSVLAVPAMFGGGIILAFTMQATGALSSYDCYTPHCPPLYQIPSTSNCTEFVGLN